MRSLAAAGLGVLVLGSCAPDLSLDLKSAPVSTAGSGGADAGSAGAADDGGRGTCLTCASCTSDDDCANGATKNICNNVTDTLGGLCVACLRDDQCDSGRRCNSNTGECVAQCTVAGDVACGNQGRTCNASRGICVECLSPADCAGTGTPYCNDECVECLKDADCTAKGLHCWVQRHSCVACAVNADCGTVNVCSGKHLCIPPP